MTPPLNEQEELEDSRRREAQARQELEADGCPPCYPPDVDIPLLQNPPEDCRAIVNYWLSFPGTGDMPLSAQLVAWRKFRAFQRKTRRSFKDFEHDLHQRRQQHGLNSAVSLTVELEQQNPLQRWIEFQNYQLVRLEAMERKRGELEKELSTPHTADEVDVIRHILGSSGKHIERHRVLFRWIEQKREVMDPSGDVRTSRQAPAHVRRTREKVSPPVLDERARISKRNTAYKRKLRHQMEPSPKTATTKNWDDGAEGQDLDVDQAAKRPPDKRRATRRAAAPRRSMRIAALPQKNYKV